ncbi:hypothetical protein CAEBREN_30593 [Caenorhabditis brenneri]|uniref:Uncharacterized protein n=1 Tax=Caenorhabditis brenneri TaxID=135651 RepID=G0N0P7_CAEBE|nr:hypothetical protein CAEBREN_30593 [Caenorhabditis brenneri]
MTEGIFGIIIEIAYIPILLVMLEKERFKMSCFKIMSLLAIVDILSIVLSCIVTGWLAYKGAVYCTYPDFTYIAGCSAKSLWCCSCFIAMTLVTNRLIDLVFPKLSNILFHGSRTYFVLLLPVLYFVYFFFFNAPTIFSSRYHSWYFDPMIFEGRSLEYENVPILFNNFFVVFATCFLYLMFSCVLGAKMKQVSTGSESRKIVSEQILVTEAYPYSLDSIQIFFQSAMICAVNLMASMIYVIMNYIDVPFWLILLGQFNWQLGNTAPVFIYLIFNRTIRNGVLRKLGLKV